jgi:hypothetical protein
VIHATLGPALRVLAFAFWFGGGIATFLATSAVFAKAEDRRVAGDFAGAILRRTNWGRNVAAFVMVFALLLPPYDRVSTAALVCLVLQGVAVVADLLTRRARQKAGGSIDSLPPGDPRRRRFAALHGVAMLVLLLQVVAAGVGLALAS